MKKIEAVGSNHADSRRSFMKRGIVAAGAAAASASLIPRALSASNRQPEGDRLTRSVVRCPAARRQARSQSAG
jgi:hypothetical protein